LSDVQQQLLRKIQLQFIIDNWKPNLFGPDQQHKVKYIISAQLNEEDDEEVEIAKDL